jgi:hypothetical protein
VHANTEQGAMADATLSQIRSLDIPVDSAIAINSLSQQEKTRQEQEQMKRLVRQ